MVDVVIAGACGRMGEALLRVGACTAGIRLAGALDVKEKVAAAGGVLRAAGGDIRLCASLDDLAPALGTVVVDFSAPAASRALAAQLAARGLKAVIGTTGLTADDLAVIRAAGDATAVLWAPNMSVGVNVLLGLVRQLAAVVPDYDIEIVEAHHRHKKDAPSGTAIALGEAAAAGRGVALAAVARHGREGLVGERPTGEIGFHAVRAGDIVGEHTVTFAGPGERIEVTHRAHSRDTFAAGALRAAIFLSTRERGFFTMADALGL